MNALPKVIRSSPLLWLLVFVPVVFAAERLRAEDTAKIAGFVAGLGSVERVDVLPFHQMGRYKWKELGLDYTLDKVEPPSPEALAQACAPFRAAGLKAY